MNLRIAVSVRDSLAIHQEERMPFEAGRGNSSLNLGVAF